MVFTIHNMNYGAAKLGEAAYFSQRFTTVSPTYAWEVSPCFFLSHQACRT